MTPPQRSRHGLATISSPIASLRAELPERFFDGFIFGVALVEFLQWYCELTAHEAKPVKRRVPRKPSAKRPRS